ncbi:hypothetical protein A2U01_0063160, partial [Trifolium medium]|nr:hypothetical protein [Trifolium medium]
MRLMMNLTSLSSFANRVQEECLMFVFGSVVIIG